MQQQDSSRLQNTLQAFFESCSAQLAQLHALLQARTQQVQDLQALLEQERHGHCQALIKLHALQRR